jgi:hypothetical protein
MKFNSWANLPEIERLLERAARWTLTDMWRPGGAIMSKGGSPRRAADARHIASHLRLMRHVFARTEDPLFLAVPRESVLHGFGEKAAPFGTRATGLVFNYLPWFLPPLNAWNDPRPEPQLEVGFAQPDVSVMPGGAARLCVSVRNKGTSPIENLRASFQPRLDFAVAEQPAPPSSLAPGGSVDLCYNVEAPGRINLTSDYHRISYAHWTAAYARGGNRHVAHAWAKVTIRRP